MQPEGLTEIEKRIRPLDETVSAMIRATDIDDAGKVLADGMNKYRTRSID